ncbi:MAG: ABC transporter ATP-binding protein [Eggerthellaceae bacterium]|nr:ABC transporter ATP-binding protein [Eggerthellaceae bacterium]
MSNTALISQEATNEIVHQDDIMIKVENVSMVFNMASEQLNSIKEYVIKFAKRQLFFSAFKALDDVSFEVKRGDVFGIIGSNGSGKSTMLKIIAGVLEPSEGTCTINGSIAPLIELGAGFDLELTARENIFLNGALLGYPKKFIEENFADIVAFAEIEHFLDMPMKNFSSGMVARVAFSVATVIVPDILIVDEVLSVGDFMFQKKCENRISELIETHGVTVLIVSHSNEQIERLCNKVIWIDKGRTKKLGDTAEICKTYRALGGRSGTPKSEARVIAAIEKTTTPVPSDSYSMITGENSYETAVQAASIIWKDEAFDTVAIVCGGTHINTVLANGLAGAYNAPVFPTRINRISESLHDLLSTHKPKRILFFDCGSSATSALNHLKELKWKPEIVDFSNKGSVFDLSKEIFAYGEKQKLWGSTAVVVDFADNPESLAGAPYLYREKCPVFSSSDTDPMKPHDLLNVLKTSEIKNLVIFGKTAHHGIENLCHKHGVEAVRIASKSVHQACVDICNWQFEQNSAPHKELCIASLEGSQWPDVLMCGAYCAHTNGALLFEDSTDLDSIALCLDFVSRNKAAISKLVFFGGEANLSELDRELLFRELL